MKKSCKSTIYRILVKFDIPKVEPGRIELPSKQAITELSTCLVLVQFSTCDRPKTAYHKLSFFSLEWLTKP